MHDPERYEATRAPAARDGSVFLKRMISEMTWKKNESILDYGCGPGSMGAEFILPAVESNDSRMFSVDISEEMVEFAMKNYPSPRVTYAVGDIVNNNFPFPDIEMDKIFSIYVLHLIRDYKYVLQRFHDLLHPGGFMGLMVANTKLLAINKTLARNPKWTKYLKDYEMFLPDFIENSHSPEILEENFKDSLKHIGFQIISLEVFPREFVYPDFDSLIDIHLSVNPFQKSIPEHLQSGFREEHRHFLIDHCNVELDGESAKFFYDSLYVVAKKLTIS